MRGGEECGATFEVTLYAVSCVAIRSLVTLSLQLHQVLSDVAATVSHNVFNRLFAMVLFLSCFGVTFPDFGQDIHA